MPILRQEMLALFLEITNEATVIAQAIDDEFLASVAGAAALAAGEQLGLSDDHVLAMQRDMAELRMGKPLDRRVTPDLEGPSTVKIVETKPRSDTHEPVQDLRRGRPVR